MTSCCGSDQLLDSLSVSSAGGTTEGFGGKPLDLPPTQLFGHDGTLTLLELQQSLKDESADVRVFVFHNMSAVGICCVCGQSGE